MDDYLIKQDANRLADLTDDPSLRELLRLVARLAKQLEQLDDRLDEIERRLPPSTPYSH